MSQPCQVTAGLLKGYMDAIDAYLDAMDALVAGWSDGKSLEELRRLQNRVDAAHITYEECRLVLN